MYHTKAKHEHRYFYQLHILGATKIRNKKRKRSWVAQGQIEELSLFSWLIFPKAVKFIG